jgi:uncharacterized radical SAM protein YgiQ
MPFLPLAGTPGSRDAGYDFAIVTGDSYVDHPSFGAAIIGRMLRSRGFAVGIIARPDPDDVEAFRLLGKPRLAFLVSAGALDSMVCSYTANRKPRSEDDYAPGGDPSVCLRGDGTLGKGVAGRRNARPDRALIAYSTKCREAYKGIAVIGGGIEASLRRLSHYDYWSDTVRRPIMLDAKLDLLVYGMAERAMLEIAARLQAGDEARAIRGVRGTVWACSREDELPRDALRLPGFEAIRGDDEASLEAFRSSFATQYRNAEAASAKPLAEKAGERFVVQEPPQPPLSRAELDEVYALPYERRAHPAYAATGGVPALAEVRFSIASSRGCFGACSFCSLAFHQGRVPTSRSLESIVDEAKAMAADPEFKGYIHDVGGPTANFRGPACAKMARDGACVDRRCLAPEPCPNLEVGHRDYLSVLRAVRSLPGVRKAFVRSGVRFDYAMLDPDPSFLRELVAHHVSGSLKVAPEHASDRVLALMGKPPRAAFDRFAERFFRLCGECGLDQRLVPYFIASHPGATLDDAIELAEYLRDSGFRPDQVQDFYPTPGTLATCAYRTGVDPLSGQKLHVPRGDRERSFHRALLQWWKPENRVKVREALAAAGRSDLIGGGKRCLVR